MSNFPWDLENRFAFKTVEEASTGACGKWTRENNSTVKRSSTMSGLSGIYIW